MVFNKLYRGDRITFVNDCIVKSSANYVKCIEEVIKKSNKGYCHTVNAVQRRNTSVPCKHFLSHCNLIIISSNFNSTATYLSKKNTKKAS